MGCKAFKPNRFWIQLVTYIIISTFLYSNTAWTYPNLQTETLASKSKLQDESFTSNIGRDYFGTIGKGILPTEILNEALTPVTKEEVAEAIDNIERLLRQKMQDDSIKPFISDIEKYISDLKKLAEKKRIFKFDAVVKNPEKFLLGFADRRGIALCNEFFQKGHPLNKVLDEALFHEAYHLRELRSVNPQFIHEDARRLQEVFLDDETHYPPGPEPKAQRSTLRKYARELIREKCRQTAIDPKISAAPDTSAGTIPRASKTEDKGYSENRGIDPEQVVYEKVKELALQTDAQLKKVVSRAIKEIEDKFRSSKDKLGTLDLDFPVIQLIEEGAINFLRKLVSGKRTTLRLCSFKAAVEDRDKYIWAFQNGSRFAIAEEFFDEKHPLNRFLPQILFHLAYHKARWDWNKPEDAHKESVVLIEPILFDDEAYYKEGFPLLDQSVKELIIKKGLAEPPAAEPILLTSPTAPSMSPEERLQADLAELLAQAAPIGPQPAIVSAQTSEQRLEADLAELLGQASEPLAAAILQLAEEPPAQAAVPTDYTARVVWEPEEPLKELNEAVLGRDRTIKRIDLAITAPEEKTGMYCIYSRFAGQPFEILMLGHFIVSPLNDRHFIQFNLHLEYIHLLSSIDIMSILTEAIAKRLNLDVYKLTVAVPDPQIENIPLTTGDGKIIQVPVRKPVPLPLAPKVGAPAEKERVGDPIIGGAPIRVIESIEVTQKDKGGFTCLGTHNFSLEIQRGLLGEDEKVTVNVRKLFGTVLNSIETILNFPHQKISDRSLRERLISAKKSLYEDIDSIRFASTEGMEKDFSIRLEELDTGKKRLVVFVNVKNSGVHNLPFIALKEKYFAYIFLDLFTNNKSRVDISLAELIRTFTDVVVEEFGKGESRTARILLYAIIKIKTFPEPAYITVTISDKLKIEVNSRGEIGRVLLGERIVSFFFVEKIFPELRRIILNLIQVKNFLRSGVLLEEKGARATLGRIETPKEPAATVTRQLRSPETQIMTDEELGTIFTEPLDEPQTKPIPVSLPRLASKWNHEIHNWETTCQEVRRRRKIQQRYKLTREELNDASIVVEVQNELMRTLAQSHKLVETTNNALGSILNLPDSIPGLVTVKNRVIARIDAIRFVLDERLTNEVGIELKAPNERDAIDNVLIFRLPYGYRQKIDWRILSYCIFDFFSRGKNTVPIEFFSGAVASTRFREFSQNIDSSFRYSGKPINLDLGGGLTVTVEKTGRITARLSTAPQRNIPLILLEKNRRDFRRDILSLPQVKTWITEGDRFQGFLMKSTPGYSHNNPRGAVTTAKMSVGRATIGIDPENEKIALNTDFTDIISRNFPDIDVSIIQNIIYQSFNKRLKLFTKDGVSLHNIGRQEISFYFINRSNSLFGNHTADGMAWANLAALQHLINQVDNPKLKSVILGIVLGIGLSHEILGHEAGINDEQTLTEQDVTLTLSLLDDLKYQSLIIHSHLTKILTGRSPYLLGLNKKIEAGTIVIREAQKLGALFTQAVKALKETITDKELEKDGNITKRISDTLINKYSSDIENEKDSITGILIPEILNELGISESLFLKQYTRSDPKDLIIIDSTLLTEENCALIKDIPNLSIWGNPDVKSIPGWMTGRIIADTEALKDKIKDFGIERTVFLIAKETLTELKDSLKTDVQWMRECQINDIGRIFVMPFSAEYTQTLTNMLKLAVDLLLSDFNLDKLNKTGKLALIIALKELGLTEIESKKVLEDIGGIQTVRELETSLEASREELQRIIESV